MTNKRREIFENLQYVVLVLLIVGQCTVGANFYLGQCVYLLANCTAVFRNFKLRRPAADKVKDCACLAITIGLIIFNLFIKKT
jgi:F0F1-type ATP synthase assembly protein I